MAIQQTTSSLLAAIQAEQLRFNRPPQPPLTSAALQTFSSQVAYTLAYELPQAYRDILAVTDGIDWNGIVLYASETRLGRDGILGSQGLLDVNVQLRLAYTPDKDFIYFAESGMDAYRHNLLTNRFEVADRVATSVFDTFATPEELFHCLLTNMLGLEDADEEDDTAF